MKRSQVRRLAFTLATATVLLLSQAISYCNQAVLPASDEAARFYSNQSGDDLEELFVQAISGAEHSILLMIYSLSDRAVIRSLNEKAEAGLSVTVLYDPEASRRIDRDLSSAIETIPRNSKGLMHQKILVIDREQVWIGSANMTRASLRHHANLVMGLHAEAIAEEIHTRAELMQHKIHLPQSQGKHYGLADQELELWWLPNAQALDRLEGLIAGAEKSVRVAMFTWTHPRLSQACVAAHERGVDVQVVIDGEAAAGAGAKVVEELRAGKVPYRLSKGPELLHHKFAYIDDKILIHGSANWTRSAFKRNDEICCVLHLLTLEQVSRLQIVWQSCWVDGREPL